MTRYTPEDPKMAKLIPIFKKNGKRLQKYTVASNYSLVSLIKGENVLKDVLSKTLKYII